MFSKTYSTAIPIPAVAIVLATHQNLSQPILFQNSKCTPNKPGWYIKAVDVSNSRDWSITQARITLTCDLKQANGTLPMLPRVDSYRGGNYPFLTVDDEIRIFAGYKDSATTQISGDDLTDAVLDNPDDKAIPKYPGNALVPIFWGFIDKIDYDASYKGTGHHITLSCRDRVRLFTDTTIINIPVNNKIHNTAKAKRESKAVNVSFKGVQTPKYGNDNKPLLGVATQNKNHFDPK